MKERADNPKQEEVKQRMTRYCLRIARYFLSTTVLTGFGVTLMNY